MAVFHRSGNHPAEIGVALAGLNPPQGEEAA
jgi:hypothetical protein